MKTCPYCGNNPVPHWAFYANESLDVLFGPIRRKILYNPFTKAVSKLAWSQTIVKIFLRVGIFFKIFSLRDDPKLCKVRRAQVLWEEAEKRGMKMREVLLFAKAIDCYVVKGTGNMQKGTVASNPQNLTLNPHPSTLFFSGLPRPTGYYNPQLDRMDDKAWFKKFMVKNGLPVPVGGAVTTFGQAKKILVKVSGQWAVGSGQKKQEQTAGHYPLTTSHFVIVKPRSGSRGRHSTTFISSESDLKQAFKVAKQLCHWVMVEEQLFGPVYRATVINFKLEGVLRGDNPQVVGDGKSTIKQLVEKKNLSAHPGVKNIVIDSGVEKFVERQLRSGQWTVDSGRNGQAGIKQSEDRSLTASHCALDYIPAKDQALALTEKIGVSYGGSSSEDFDICHPDNIELFETAARALGDPIVGFDFIIADIAKSWKEQKCGFIEVNTLPFINLHHDPLLGKPRNVAAKIWDMIYE